MYLQLQEEEWLGRVLSLARFWPAKALALFKGDAKWENRTGGYFCLADSTTGLPMLVMPIGQVPTENGARYATFSMEKARRLSEHPAHLSSWQSRNRDLNMWGGAIRAGQHIYSISGFPELGDEAMSMALAYSGQATVGHMSLDPIAELSGNPYWSLLKPVARSHRFD